MPLPIALADIKQNDLNFAPIAVMVIMLLALISWFAPKYGRRYHWKGPRTVRRDDVIFAGTPPDSSPRLKARLGN